MATNYTEHYQLNQWEAEDKVLRTAFNADNLKIDGALHALAGQVASLDNAVSQKANTSALTTEVNARTAEISAVNAQLAKLGNCQIYYGTYVGDGAASRTLTFPHKPLLVIVMAGNIILRAVQGVPYAMCRTNGEGGELATAAWEGSSLAWSGRTPTYICNGSDVTYYVVALMDVGG